MSLYYEAADVLTSPTNAGGSLKSRIFGNKNLKSQPAQIYALVIETCKWSFVLKEVIERAALLSLEHKLTPIISVLLVHDLLLAKRGIALPATHGLRSSVERHKARLQAEFTKARVRRSLGSVEAFKEYVDSGEEGSSKEELPYPRWIRINTLRTQLEDQLETTFADYERVATVNAVRERGCRRIYIDVHIPNLIAVSPYIDLTKNEAYTSGALVFQDKASCFPTYLLDPLPEDGNIIDTCAAPGNKTTHLAAILLSHHPELDDDSSCTIHAFEKSKPRAETLKKMLSLADAQKFTKVHAGMDFLKVDPLDPAYKTVGALLLDPSCSGSGIVGRDDVPELHLPTAPTPTSSAKGKMAPPPRKDKMGKEKSGGEVSLKRKRDEIVEEASTLDIINDDGTLTPVFSPSDLQARLSALSTFQLALVQHAMAFPAAKKITYSTCSIHAAENEEVVLKALGSAVAKERGWRVLRREEQVRGLREWPHRGDEEAAKDTTVREACVRAMKGDEEGTMGFFVAGFVREEQVSGSGQPRGVVRDEKGFIVRDLMGFPVIETETFEEDGVEGAGEEEEWNGFKDDGDNNGGSEMKNDEAVAENSPGPAVAAATVKGGANEEGKPTKKRKKKGRSRNGT